MATEQRLIAVNARIEEIRKAYCTNCDNYDGVRCRSCWVDDGIGFLEDAPTVDAVEVVRCRDCKNYMTVHCTCDGCCISDDWYCADGERRTDHV